VLEVRLGDFRRALEGGALEPGSFDVVATDPPYGRARMDLWDALADLSAAVLRPGGMLMAYAGQAHLDAELAALSRRLEYRWTLAVELRGSHGIVRGFMNSWKPVVVYARPPAGRPPLRPVLPDLIRGSGEDKRFHKWGQPASEMVPVLGALAGLVAPGRAARVLDPMAGGGGILAACAELGFDCLGYEVDPRAFAALTERFRASPAGRAADGSGRAASLQE